MKNHNLNIFNFHVTNDCNYHCSYCFGKFQPSKITFEQACLVIDCAARFFKEKGIADGRINLAGGEPLLYRDLDALIDYIHKNGMKVSLVTNGSLLKKERVVSWKGKVDCIGLSVDSALEETNKQIGRCGKDGELKKETLIALAECIKENGIKLKINTVVSRLNVHEDLRTLYSKLQPDRLKLFQMQVVKGVNDGAIKDKITAEQFYAFYQRHQNCGKEVVFEESGSMENSYLMINPQGQFLLNNGGVYTPYGDCLNEELSSILKRVPLDSQKFDKRYGTHKGEDDE